MKNHRKGFEMATSIALIGMLSAAAIYVAVCMLNIKTTIPETTVLKDFDLVKFDGASYYRYSGQFNNNLCIYHLDKDTGNILETVLYEDTYTMKYTEDVPHYTQTLKVYHYGIFTAREYINTVYMSEA